MKHEVFCNMHFSIFSSWIRMLFLRWRVYSMGNTQQIWNEWEKVGSEKIGKSECEWNMKCFTALAYFIIFSNWIRILLDIEFSPRKEQRADQSHTGAPARPSWWTETGRKGRRPLSTLSWQTTWRSLQGNWPSPTSFFYRLFWGEGGFSLSSLSKDALFITSAPFDVFIQKFHFTDFKTRSIVASWCNKRNRDFKQIYIYMIHYFSLLTVLF